MEALLVHLTRKLEGQPHTYLRTESPLGPHFSWTIPAETYEPANRNRNAAYSQQARPGIFSISASEPVESTPAWLAVIAIFSPLTIFASTLFSPVKVALLLTTG